MRRKQKRECKIMATLAKPKMGTYMVNQDFVITRLKKKVSPEVSQSIKRNAEKFRINNLKKQ